LLKANILFIINPISGGKKKSKIPRMIDNYLDKSKFNANFSFTEFIGHGAELAEEAVKKDFDIIVAVGGDGTINEVAAKVMEHQKILGIIPQGSGNGLARFLKIPMDIKKAILLINNHKVETIDCATLNGKFFFNMAGMGFDAHISAEFANHKTRGLYGYVKTVMKELSAYRPQTYQINIDGVGYTRNAFVVSIANSSQYGNNVFISPASSTNDGLLDVCIVKDFPLYKLPVLAYEMIMAKTHQSNMVEIIRGKHILINRGKEDPVHLDGESFLMDKEIAIDVISLALKIMTKN
jgi:diacylglycerol kinase (ATP)